MPRGTRPTSQVANQSWRGSVPAMEHRIDPERVHHEWDNRLEPILRVASGDAIHYELRVT